MRFYQIYIYRILPSWLIGQLMSGSKYHKIDLKSEPHDCKTNFLKHTGIHEPIVCFTLKKEKEGIHILMYQLQINWLADFNVGPENLLNLSIILFVF